MTSTAATYTVTLEQLNAHLLTVEAVFGEVGPEGLELWLPVWIPGSYMVREFAKNIVTMKAFDGGRAVPIDKTGKSSWRVHGPARQLTVVYEVYAWDLSVRTAHCDLTHAFFNGTSVFLAARGREAHPHRVVLVAPPHDTSWEVATTLPRIEGETWGFGVFEAPDYDALIDHPVEMGTFRRARFEVAGVPHDVAITGRHGCDMARLCEDVQAICEAQAAVFGGAVPCERYLFLLTVVGKGYGGLEHRASTALICKRDDLPVPGRGAVSDGYRQLLGLFSHEYFHTWNVKRILPRVFVPFDLEREVHTTLLWAFEGITSYFDDAGVRRAGCITTKSYLELLGQTMTRVHRRHARRVQSVADSSFDAWTKFYRQDENAPNAVVSYYAKGALVALALDLQLRRHSGDAIGLDTVMGELWKRYGDGSGVPEDGLERLVEELCGSPMTSFFDAYVRGTEELPLAELLSHVGITVHWRARMKGRDLGGKPGPDRTEEVFAPCHVGVELTSGGGGARVDHVHARTPAMTAGLAARDVIVAWDGLKVDAGSLKTRIRSATPGLSVTVHAFRRDELMVFEVTPEPAPETTCYLTLDEDAGPEVCARRERWLSGTTCEVDG